MKFAINLLTAAAFGLATLATPMPFMASEAEAASKKYCKKYAKKIADKKARERVVGTTVVGGLAGLAIGSAMGKKKTAVRGTIIGAGSGLALGSVSASARWQDDYDDAYAYCRAEL